MYLKTIVILSLLCYNTSAISQILKTKDGESLGSKKSFIESCIKGANKKLIEIGGIKIEAKSYYTCMANEFIPQINSAELLEALKSGDVASLFKKEEYYNIIMGCIDTNNIKFEDNFKFNKLKDNELARFTAIKECVNELKNDTSIDKEFVDKYAEDICTCVVEKVIHSDMEFKDMASLEDVNSIQFNELLMPCVTEILMKDSSENNLYNPNDIIGTNEFCTIDLLNVANKYYKLPLSFGNISKYFMFDTGASDLIIDEKLEEELIKKGLIKKEDYLPEEQEFEMADNTIVKAKVVIVNNIKICDYTVNNVEVAIIKGGSLLVGNSLIKKFSKYEILEKENKLKLYR